MSKKLTGIGVIIILLVYASSAYAWADVWIKKTIGGNNSVSVGTFFIRAEGEVVDLQLEHPSRPAPIMLMRNPAGFNGITLEREEYWDVLTDLLPSGSYQLTVTGDTSSYFRPFDIDYSLMPALPVVTSPADDEVLSSPDLTVTWETPPAGLYEVVVHLKLGYPHPEDFSISLEPTATSYRLGEDMLLPGERYAVSVEFVRRAYKMVYSNEQVVNVFTTP